MKEKMYKVPVIWSLIGHYLVKSDTPEQAKQYCIDNFHIMPLPDNGEYLEDSFEFDGIEAIVEVTE